ncbi:hypothetical protein BGZ93_006569 [Podila epicladia]|nr:hypothetical protein BGZ93_006569 [Podila epicladia]
METTRFKKQPHNVQELRAGTVQRLSQQFLKANISQPAKPISPIRYQSLAIPKPFVAPATNGQPTEPPTPSPAQHTRMESYGGGHSRQQSAPQLFVRLNSPAISDSTPSLSSVTFTQSRNIAGGMSCSSVGSDDSFVSALSHLDSPKEPSSPKTVPLWKQMLDAIEQEDRPGLDKVLHAFDFALVLQTLVTWTLANKDNHYHHDPDVLLDAKELLGPTVDHLNMIQVACFLFNEELALDLLNFVATACEELESRKILYEFMGKLWGDGNTTLHLASFLGMADLTKRLLDLGANAQQGASGSSEFIDDLLLAESSDTQEDLGAEAILSPTVISKPSAPFANPSLPSLQTKESDTGIEKQDEQPQQYQQRSAGHIPPKLRSYQSSPSIRLYAGVSQEKNSSISTKSKSGAPKKRVSFDPQSLMADASRTGDLQLYKAMLDVVKEEGKSGTIADIVNCQSVSRKLSSLHLAASYNHLPLCQFLVTMGASVNLTDMEGWTPMHCAAAEGHLTVFEFLIKEPDADLQSATYDGEMLEDVVEDDDLRQKVIDIIENEAQSRGPDDSDDEGE